MRRPLLALLAAGALLLAALPDVSAQSGKGGDKAEKDDPAGPAASPPDDDGGRGSGRGQGRSEGDDAGEGNETPRGRVDEDRLAKEAVKVGRKAEDTAEELLGMGHFYAEGPNRSVMGKHVRFFANGTGIRNYTVAMVTLFDVSYYAPPSSVRLKDGGSTFVMEGEDFRLKVHDNPMGTLHLRVPDTATFRFANATLDPEVDGKVDFVVEGVTGWIKADNATIVGDSVIVSGKTTVHVNKARGAHDKHRADISTAVAKGHVGAEATLGKRPSGDQEELVQEVVSYGNVTMTTLRAERGNLTVAIEGHGDEGRVVVLNVDGRILGAQKRDDLTILLDNLTIPAASSIADVLDPDDDGFLPEYYVVFDPGTETFQLLVSVPHYSVHILSVNSFIPLPPPPVVFGIVAGVAALVPGAYVLFRRKDE